MHYTLYIFLGVILIYTIIELVYYEIQKIKYFKKLKKYDYVIFDSKKFRFLSYDKKFDLIKTIDEYGIYRTFFKEDLIKENIKFKTILDIFGDH